MKRFQKVLILLFTMLSVMFMTACDNLAIMSPTRVASKAASKVSAVQSKAAEESAKAKTKASSAASKVAEKNETSGGTVNVGKAPIGPAIAALSMVKVADDAAAEKYDRGKFFGEDFVNLDNSADGCDSRQKAYKRDMVNIVMKPGAKCTVQSATLPVDSYTLENNVEYVKGRGADVDIDHRVTLEDAWKHGLGTDTATNDDEGQQKIRLQFANDPYNLVTVNSRSNRQKSYRTIDEWEAMGQKTNRKTGEKVKVELAESQKCGYVAHIVGIKVKYRLSMTSAEHTRIGEILKTCPSQMVPADPNMSWEK